MTRFLHITDLHVSVPATEDESRQTDTPAALRRLVQIAGQLEPRPDFIVASGDLTNIGDEASYAYIAEAMAELEMPVVYALGNHDRRAGFYSAFPELATDPTAPLDYDRVHAGVHVISLDSSVPGKVSGAFDDSQIVKLKEMLATHPDLPKLIAIHHPPRINPGKAYKWATLTDEATTQLSDAIAGHKVLAILSGHVHMNRVALWNGTPIVITMGQQSTIDLTRSQGMSVIEGTGFAICDLPDTGLQVTYVPLAEPNVIKEVSEERLQAFS